MEILSATQTMGVEFKPGAAWALGCDTYSSDVSLQWQSPGGVWVDLYDITEAGLFQAGVAANETYRLTTASAGSRVWLIR